MLSSFLHIHLKQDERVGPSRDCMYNSNICLDFLAAYSEDGIMGEVKENILGVEQSRSPQQLDRLRFG